MWSWLTPAPFLHSSDVVVERRTLNELVSIWDIVSHPLHDLLDKEQSSFSNIQQGGLFLPTAITLYKSPSLCQDIIVH